MKKLLIRNIANGRKLLFGTIKSIRTQVFEQDGEKTEVTYMELQGKTYDSEKQTENDKVVTVEFRDSDYSMVNYGKTFSMLNDRIKKTNPKEGSFISVLAVPKKDATDKYLANDFKFKGMWKIPATEDSRELNFYIGTACNPIDDEEGRFWKCSVPCEIQKDVTKWTTITCWNAEGNALGENAKKVLSPIQKDDKTIYKQAVFCCGEEKVREYNGNSYYQTNCFSFELI